MELNVNSPLGFEKINFRSESISWDLTINIYIYIYIYIYMYIVIYSHTHCSLR